MLHKIEDRKQQFCNDKIQLNLEVETGNLKLLRKLLDIKHSGKVAVSRANEWMTMPTTNSPLAKDQAGIKAKLQAEKVIEKNKWFAKVLGKIESSRELNTDLLTHEYKKSQGYKEMILNGKNSKASLSTLLPSVTTLRKQSIKTLQTHSPRPCEIMKKPQIPYSPL